RATFYGSRLRVRAAAPFRNGRVAYPRPISRRSRKPCHSCNNVKVPEKLRPCCLTVAPVRRQNVCSAEDFRRGFGTDVSIVRRQYIASDGNLLAAGRLAGSGECTPEYAPRRP